MENTSSELKSIMIRVLVSVIVAIVVSWVMHKISTPKKECNCNTQTQNTP